MATTDAEVWTEAMHHLSVAWSPAPSARAWIFEPDVVTAQVMPSLPERGDGEVEATGIRVLAIVNDDAIVMDTVTKAWTILHMAPV